MILESSKRKKETREYTIVACKACGATERRRFADGDYVFAEIKDAEQCKTCGSTVMLVEQIFSEVLE